MMTTMKNTLATMLLTGAVAVSGLTACSSSDDSIAEEPTPIVNPTQPQTYHVRIHASMGDGDGTTRAVDFDVTDPVTGNPTSNSTFTTSEKVYVYNKTTGKVIGGYLQPTNISDDGTSCDLEGTLNGTLSEGNAILLLYNPSQVETGGTDDYNRNYTFFDYYDYQDGTVGKVIDGATATATVGGYTSGALTTTATASFVNAQSMFRFQFKDGNNNLINVFRLIISSKNNALVKAYLPLCAPGSQFMAGQYDLYNHSAASDYIYLALCFDESKTNGDELTFTAIKSNGDTYRATKLAPDGGFKNGKYYWNSSPIQLQANVKQKPTTLHRNDGGSINEPSGDSNNYFIYGDESQPLNITFGGTSYGYCFKLFGYSHGSVVNLDNFTATYSDDILIWSGNDITVNITGNNTLLCQSVDGCIVSGGTLKLTGNGTLTVTAGSYQSNGIYGDSNYNTNHSSVSEEVDVTEWLALDPTKTTVMLSKMTDNGDNTFTWTYTVAPQ